MLYDFCYVLQHKVKQWQVCGHFQIFEIFFFVAVCELVHNIFHLR